MKQIKIQCPAKVNLTLKVTGKREDGFHNIDSTMQTINLFDFLTISVEKNNVNEIVLSGNSDEIPYNEKNLVYKAGMLFLSVSGFDGYKITVYIEKNIPVAAGLAGGSTDAAGMLYGLNKLFDECLSREQLHELCAQLGSDLNFCLEGGRQKTSGRGEILEPLPFEDFEISLIKPINLGISAKEAYTKFAEKMKNDPTPQPPPARGGGAKHRFVAPAIQKNAIKLRNNPTPQERKLWQYLKSSQMNGIKFRRQQPIGNYIVDFVSFDSRLIIELDGGQHSENILYDRQRDEYLKSQGFDILRIWNNDVDNNIEGVFEYILQANCPRPLREGVRGWGTRDTYPNDLEWAVIDDYVELQNIKKHYPNAVMSGSGSTYFGVNMNFEPQDGFWVKNSLKAIPYGVSEV